MSELTTENLQLFLEVTLPIKVSELRRKGCITRRERKKAIALSSEICMHGDVLQFESDDGRAGAIAGRLASALAILCFDIADDGAATLNQFSMERVTGWVEGLTGEHKSQIPLPVD